MRTFYIFKINSEFKSLMKENPYNLYKTFEKIYYLNKRDISLAIDIIDQIIEPIDIKNINLLIFNTYRNDLNYTKFNNIHMLNNYFNDENTELIVKKTHIQLRSTVEIPSFLKNIIFDNYFVCDFPNKDYFWLVDDLIAVNNS